VTAIAERQAPTALDSGDLLGGGISSQSLSFHQATIIANTIIPTTKERIESQEWSLEKLEVTIIDANNQWQ
jgi:hypothetical protein